MLSALRESVSSDAELQQAAVSLEGINRDWPPASCYVETDQETGQRLSTVVADYDAWKEAVEGLGCALQNYAETWVSETRAALGQAFSGWSDSLPEEEKLSVIEEVKDAVRSDAVLYPEWNAQYAAVMGCEGAAILDEISRLSGEIDQGRTDLSALEDEYLRRYEELELSSWNDDPPPQKKDLERFLSYRTRENTDGLSSNSWSASMTMLAVLPDSYSYNLQGGSTQDMRDRDYYDCEAPVARWPVGNGTFPALYTTSMTRNGFYREAREDGLSGDVTDGRIF